MAGLIQQSAFLAMPNIEATARLAQPGNSPGTLRGRLETVAVNAADATASGDNWSTSLAAATAVLGASAVASTARRIGHRRNKARKARPVALRATGTVEKPNTTEREDIRNIAIIAHVDHGKTTLTNALMKQCGMKEEKSMDSNVLEMERGITILAKNASVTYNNIKINIVDTPGHADFGGEVERILNMADLCLLLVDAQEGPMPQTKFVLRQALKLNKKVMVCINKVDKEAARPDWVLDTTFDLFTQLGADDKTCDFPVVYASGFKGVASRESPTTLKEDLKPLLDAILEECPKPMIDASAPLQMLVSNLDYDDYVGRIAIGRITSGNVRVGDKVSIMYGENGEIREATVSKLWEFRNNEKSVCDEVRAGDICAFAGTSDVKIGDTVVDSKDPRPLPPIIVEEPTVAMEFSVNKSPFAATLKASTKVTAPMIKARLEKECMTNLALRLESTGSNESFTVKGRGTLQLGILMENMRREGFEIMVSAPRVLIRVDPETNQKTEPCEEVVVEVPIEYQGLIMEEFAKKGGLLKTMESGAVQGSMVYTFEILTRNAIGMSGTFMKSTSGTAVMTSQFSHWAPLDDKKNRLRERGSIVTTGTGKATTYALTNMAPRGKFFIEAGVEVYEGMVIGQHNKAEELTCNIVKEKAVSNVRASGATVVEKLPPPIQMSMDDWLGYMDTDEILEVTPGPLRLCKKTAKMKR